jgi:hypothetical protein
MNWSVIHEKKSFVIFTKPTKIKVYYMEKKKIYILFHKTIKKILVRGSNAVVIDFHKTKQKLYRSVTHRKIKSFFVFWKPQKFKLNAWKKYNLYSF